MWSMWKDMLIQSIDKHAPLKSKRVGTKTALWITDNLCREMHKRDFFKKKAMLDRINSQHGLNTDDPGTRQIANSRKPNVNTLFTT